MSVVIIDQAAFDSLKTEVSEMRAILRDIHKAVISDNRLYNIKETAEKLGIARQTLHNYINLGVVTEYITKGNRIYFTRESIDTIKKAKV